ncbi:MAG: hypothetical protein ABH952_07640 [Candidatus Omnitrophota bacterium]
MYGKRENRELLKEKGIWQAFNWLGKKGKDTKKEEQYIRQKQR